MLVPKKVRKGGPGAKGKPICQYTLDGNLLTTFKNTAEAERQTGIGNRLIAKCLNGAGLTGGGFRWSRLNESLRELTPERNAPQGKYGMSRKEVALHTGMTENQIRHIIEKFLRVARKSPRLRILAREYGYVTD